MKRFLFLGLMVLASAGGVSAAALTPVEVTMWADRLDVRDSLTRVVLFERFTKAVPPAQQTEALGQILEDAVKRKKIGSSESILSFLSRKGTRMPWSSTLANNVALLSKSEDKNLRRGVLRVYGLRPPSESRVVVLSFLDDDDEVLRRDALISVRKWPERESIYQNYVSRNANVKKRSETVRQATLLLDRSKKGQLK